MSKTNSSILIENLEPHDLSWLAAFENEGQHFKFHRMYVPLTVEAFLELLEPALGVGFTVTVSENNSIFIESPVGTIDFQCQVIKDGRGLIINGKVMGTPPLHAALRHIKETNRIPEPPRAPGVYDVDIHHLYIDGSGRQQSVHHRRRTNQFDDIYPELYPRLDTELLMRMYSESQENNLILTGEPGTGKTCFVKRCLRDLAVNKKRDIFVVYVKDQEILKADAFWAQMSERSPDVIVLDDLDDELKPRTKGRNDIVNHMLSFSDGLFDVKTKILITSNQPNTAIDAALIRPGRCFDILSLPQLTQDEALTVWVDKLGQTPESFTEVFHDCSGNISQAFIMSEYQRYIKVGTSPYLKDQSLSIRREVQAGALINADAEEDTPATAASKSVKS